MNAEPTALNELHLHLQQRVSSLRETLAQFTLGNLSYVNGTDPEKIPDDAVTDVFCGVNLLRQDLENALNQLELQKTLSTLRSEMWKMAAGKALSEYDLIEKLLRLVGEQLDLSRASYYSFQEFGSDAVCVRQWCSPSETPASDAVIPFALAEKFFGREHVAIREVLGSDIPDVMEILKRYNVKSFLCVPYGDCAKPQGILTFSDCRKDREWTDTDIEILSEMAKIVAARSAQWHAEKALKETNVQLEKLVKSRTIALASTNRKLKEDIAARESVQQALADEKERLSVTLRSIGDAVITVDTEQRVVLFNNAAEVLTGWTFEEANGQQINDILLVLHERNREPCRNFVDLALCAGDESVLEMRSIVVARNCTERIVAYKGATIRDRVGKSIGAVVVLRDITEGEKLEEELLRIRKLESVGLLAGGIAHDFNNILTGIISNLFLAKVNTTDNAETCRLISEAEKAAFRASKLTKQLLTFSKGGSPVKENASIPELIRETVGFCLSGSNVDYVLELPEDLLTVEVDKGQIDQVLNNLIINADQAMPDGGTVTITAQNFLLETDSRSRERKIARTLPLKPGPYVRISVKDEGTGISKKNIERIFDPYFTTKENGSGLGLTSAYSIIQKHGGHLGVESKPGKGSVFSFYIPATKSSVENEIAGEKTSLCGSGRILVMDDDAIVRMVVERLLSRAGFSVVSVANGSDAVAKYVEATGQQNAFSLVIMDLTIPGGIGGKEAVKKVKAFDPNARVIVFSGYSNDPIMAQYRQYGFDGVLRKPFNIEEFKKVINAVLGGHSQAEPKV